MREARLAPDGSDLQMLNHPESQSQGFRQNPSHVPEDLCSGGCAVMGARDGSAHGVWPKPLVASLVACLGFLEVPPASSRESHQEARIPDVEALRPVPGQECVGIGGLDSTRMAWVPWMETRGRDRSCALPAVATPGLLTSRESCGTSLRCSSLVSVSGRGC